MNICYLIPNLNFNKNGTIIGGSANAAINLARKLAIERGHDLTLVVGISKNKRNLIKELKIEGLRLAPIFINSEPPSYNYGIRFVFKAVRVLRKINKEYKFNLIHGHSGVGIYGLSTAISGWVIRKPAVHTIYCPVKPSFGKRISSKIGLWFINQIIGISKNVSQSLLSLGIPGEKVNIIPPLVDFNKYYSQKDAQNRQKFENAVLFVGNLRANKGLDLLIDAMGKVKERIPKLKLFITTEPLSLQFQSKNFAQIIKRKIKKYGLEDEIIQLNTVDDMAGLIAISSLVVIPFRNTYGPSDYALIALEAMACQKPVVSFDVGGLSEIVEDGYNGRLIPPENTKKMAESISELLLNKKEMDKMGENAYRYIKAFLSPENTYLKMEKIYGRYE